LPSAEIGTAQQENPVFNFKCALDVQEHINREFPGVNIMFNPPRRAVSVPYNHRGRKTTVQEWHPVTQEEQEQLAPLVAEYHRLYNLPMASTSIEDEDVFGDRMI
jgi:hypothetical protein